MHPRLSHENGQLRQLKSVCEILGQTATLCSLELKRLGRRGDCEGHVKDV